MNKYKKTKTLSDSQDRKRPILRGSFDNFLENIRVIVKPLANILGSNCEIVLHDLRDMNSSIVEIANGHVTGRKVGDPIISGPLDDEGIRTILSKNNKCNLLNNYVSRTRDGRNLKSTSIFFRNYTGKPIFALCINLDLTYFNIAKELVNEICKVETPNSPKTASLEGNHNSDSDFGSALNEIVKEALLVPIY